MKNQMKLRITQKKKKRKRKKVLTNAQHKQHIFTATLAHHCAIIKDHQWMV